MRRFHWAVLVAAVAVLAWLVRGADDALVVLVVAGLVWFTMSTYRHYRQFEGQVDQRNKRRYDEGFRERHGGGEDPR